ncbi:MAG: hypothetical protein QOH88_916 [Verrucomicrobiota bacterium]|jgi:hypothetical protein
MNDSEKSPATAPRSISPEAIIGMGITVAELGLLCLLLGWAQYMRSVPSSAWMWAALGVVLVVVGGLAALFAWSKQRRRKED